MTERFPNCGSGEIEDHRASCGQRLSELRTPTREFLREALDDIFSLDSRIWRTLIALFRSAGLGRGDREDPVQAGRVGVRARGDGLVRPDGAPDGYRTDGVAARSDRLPITRHS